MARDRTFIIVGASLAGAKAAETLREEGFDGRVILLGAEPERPYERPPLSKGYLRGEAGRDAVYVHGGDFYEERDIELRTSTNVVGVHPHESEVALEGGNRIRYDGLLLATGAEPRRLPVAGADLDGVLYLRSVEDSDAIRARLDRGGRVVVVGSGWIGSEVAASARQRGLEVTILERTAVPLERVLGAEAGVFFRDLHADHGVEFLGGTGLKGFEGSGSVERVVTSDGLRIDCDFAVVGVGVAPRADLASQAGIATDDGILADEHLATEAPGIFAAGDVANARHPLLGRRVRVEHWANALNQGPAAARAMLGRSEAYDRLPYFFSDQYETGMEYSGHATSWDRVVLRGDPAGGEFIAFWLEGDRVLAGMNVNVWGVTDPIQRLIRERVAVEDHRLADASVPLEELVPATTNGARLAESTS